MATDPTTIPRGPGDAREAKRPSPPPIAPDELARRREAAEELLSRWAAEGDEGERRETIAAIRRTILRPAPRSGVDAAGRLLPASVAEREARRESSTLALEAIDRIVDDTDTDRRWADVMRGIDEGRPHRKLFEGQY